MSENSSAVPQTKPETSSVEVTKSKNQEEIIPPAPIATTNVTANAEEISASMKQIFQQNQKLFVKTTTAPTTPVDKKNGSRSPFPHPFGLSQFNNINSDISYEDGSESRVEQKVCSPSFQRPQYQSGGSFKLRQLKHETNKYDPVQDGDEFVQSPILKSALKELDKEKAVHHTEQLLMLQKENDIENVNDPNAQIIRKSSKINPPEKALQRLGVDAVQVQRSVALKRMGITEQDLWQAAPHFTTAHQRKRTVEIFDERYSRKIIKILGGTEEQILRRKALSVLGTTEEEYQHQRSISLSKLGTMDSDLVRRKSGSMDASCLPIKK